MFDGVTRGRVDRVLRQLGGIDSLSFQRMDRRLELGFRFCDVCAEAIFTSGK